MLDRMWKKGNPPNIVGGGVNSCNYSGKQYKGSSKK